MTAWYLIDAEGNTTPASRDTFVFGLGNVPIECGGRQVARNNLNGREISTVFLAIDHNFRGGGLPILFETMVFGADDLSPWQEIPSRYATIREAREGHDRIVERIRAGLLPLDSCDAQTEPLTER